MTVSLLLQSFSTQPSILATVAYSPEPGGEFLPSENGFRPSRVFSLLGYLGNGNRLQRRYEKEPKHDLCNKFNAQAQGPAR